jgi:hypothetical protein
MSGNSWVGKHKKELLIGAALASAPWTGPAIAGLLGSGAAAGAAGGAAAGGAAAGGLAAANAATPVTGLLGMTQAAAPIVEAGTPLFAAGDAYLPGALGSGSLSWLDKAGAGLGKAGKFAQLAQMSGLGQQPQPPQFMPAQRPQAPSEQISNTQLGAGLYPFVNPADEERKRQLALLLGGNYGY